MKMSTLRNSIAAAFRSTPYFRGKRRLGIAIGRFLSNKYSDKDCISTVKMQDDSIMQLDVRSRTEQWSYWTGDYDSLLISRLSSCLKQECVVFDIGANIGFYSVPLGNKVKALKGSLHAFEPVKNNFKRLLNNIALNNLEDVISVHEIALSDEEGIIEMSMESDNNAQTGNAFMLKGNLANKSFDSHSKVPSIKLDTFVQEQQISNCHFIKIDIEGAEVMFLRGGQLFLSKHRPIIYGEFNSYFIKQFGQSFIDVVNIVTPWKYRFFKQIEKAQFIEIKNPGIGLEHVLLVPLETPDIVLSKLGVIA